jgi:hypothetical protein
MAKKKRFLKQRKRQTLVDNSFNLSENELKEYRRLRKNAKSKIKRVKENFGSLVVIMDEKDGVGKMVRTEELVTIPTKDEFTSRKEFNKWKKEMQDFTNRSKKNYQFEVNKYNIVGSEKLLHQIEKDTKEAQLLADKERAKIENLPFVSRFKKQAENMSQRIAISGDEARKTGVYKPDDFNFEEVRDIASLLDKSENVHVKANTEYYDRRKEKMKENFIKILQLQFNSDADELIEKIKGIPADYFYEMYMMFDEFDFDEYSSEGNDDMKDMDNLQMMLGYVDLFYSDSLDFMLKSFPNG